MSNIPTKETLTCEFKSDRKCLSDRDLIEAVVCMANGEGGDIYLGIEDNGKITGLHKKHTNLEGLSSLISNRTNPHVLVDIISISVETMTVAKITVPSLGEPVATNDGVIKRRRLQVNGQPECVPYLPHEFPSRRASFGLTDNSALPLTGATLEDLDPFERSRLRQFIERYNGDKSLISLDDQQLDSALGLITREGSTFSPTLTGILLIGKLDSLRRLVPNHEVAFQVLDGENVQLNEFMRTPLLSAIDYVNTLMKPLNPEKEFQSGLFRVPVPKIDPLAFREALANAIVHRDYYSRGAIHIRLAGNELTISNPGGFVDGVDLDNILTTEPRPRNPSLADALKRVGLVERTGRGVDLIYRGLLRFGRHIPDYSSTNSHSVVLKMSLADADEKFLKFVLEEESIMGSRLPIDALIILNILRVGRRLKIDEIARAVQKNTNQVKASIENLVESGMLEAHGNASARTYTLSSIMYNLEGKKAEYTRQAGFSKLQNEQLVINFVAQHGEISRREVMNLCRMTKDQSYLLLKKLCEDDALKKEGIGKSTHYILKI